MYKLGKDIHHDTFDLISLNFWAASLISTQNSILIDFKSHISSTLFVQVDLFASLTSYNQRTKD